RPPALTPPRWLPDPYFDLSWHVRRAGLPPPADLDAVLDVARREVMEAFGPARPLWKCTVLSGLSDGRAAVVLKVHHSLTDGIGGILIAREVLDATRDSAPRPDVEVTEPPRRGTLTDALAWNSALGLTMARGAVGAGGSLLRRGLTDPIGTDRRDGALAGSLARLTRPVTSTLSPLMTARSTRRELTVLEIPVEQLGAAARRAGCRLNDAYLTGVLIGVREYHRRHGARLERVRVTMPISVREPDDPIGGNRVTLARFALPTAIEDADELMRAVHEAAGRWRREPSLGYSGAVAAALN